MMLIDESEWNIVRPSGLNASPFETTAAVSSSAVHVRSVSSRYSCPFGVPRGSYIVPA
jgi:hypothetical protein